MTDATRRRPRASTTAALALALVVGSAAQAQSAAPPPTTPARAVRSGDYIVAVVNQELVTAGEVQRRIDLARGEAARSGQRLPPDGELRRQVVEALIDERAMVTAARESGMSVDDEELDRAVANIAQQNQVSMDTLRRRLREQGVDYGQFRANVRDQILIERLREREVYQRIRVGDDEIDRALAAQRAAAGSDAPTNIAQILVTVPDGADAATVAARRERAEAALARVRAGEPFADVARAVSEDGNRERGGEIGLRPASRLPDVFVAATRDLKPGDVAPQLLRTGAGFHVLKLLARDEPELGRVQQTRVRHVLLRPSAQLPADVAARRLVEYRRQIESGAATFEDIARRYSEDGSAAGGGELGWATAGQMVPEFEQAMAALPIGGLSQPVESRFGLHLIQHSKEVALVASHVVESHAKLWRAVLVRDNHWRTRRNRLGLRLPHEDNSRRLMSGNRSNQVRLIDRTRPPHEPQDESRYRLERPKNRNCDKRGENCKHLDWRVTMEQPNSCGHHEAENDVRAA